MAAIFGTSFGAISGIRSTTISRVVAEIKPRKAEEGNQQLEDESTELKQRKYLKQFAKAETNKIKSEGFENDNSKSIVEQWRRQFNVLNIFWKICSSKEWREDIYILVSEGRRQLEGENDKSYFQQEEVSRTVSSEIQRAISGVVFEAVLKQILD